MVQNQSLSTLRALTHEIRNISHGKSSKRAHESLRHIIGLYRENQVTEKRYCRPDYNHYVADTYLTYLQAMSKQNKLMEKYFNRKDKSIDESAKLVGLKLPDRPVIN